MSKFTNEEKEKLFNNWIAISPSFSGEITKKDRFLDTHGNWWDKLFGVGMGIYTLTSQKSAESLMFLFNSLKSLNSSKNWVKNVTQHLKFEDWPQDNEHGISFWPSSDKICYQNDFFNETSDCTMGLFDTSNIIQPLPVSLFEPNEQEKKVFDFNHPGIPLIVMYNSKLPTPTGLKATNIANQEIIARGDGIVTTLSSILHPLKWAIEYDDQKIGKPVKFIEMCSMFNQKISPFDHLYIPWLANSKYIKDKRRGNPFKNDLSKTKEL